MEGSFSIGVGGRCCSRRSSLSLYSTPLWARANDSVPQRPSNGWLLQFRFSLPWVVNRVCPMTALVSLCSRAGRRASRQCFPERSVRRIRSGSSGHQSSPDKGRCLHRRRCFVPRSSRRNGHRWRRVPRHNRRRAVHRLPVCPLPLQALFRSSHRFLLLLPFQVPPKTKIPVRLKEFTLPEL